MLFHGLEKSRPVPICKVSLPQAKTAGTGCCILSKKRRTTLQIRVWFCKSAYHEAFAFSGFAVRKKALGGEGAVIPIKEAELG